MRKKYNPYYESFKCKYCLYCFYEHGAYRCSYHDSIKGGSLRISKDHLCKDFLLSNEEQRLCNASPTLVQRHDGSYIMELTPDLYDGIQEYRKYQQDVQNTNELMFVWAILGVGLFILWLIFKPFILGIIEFISGIFDFLS